MRFTQIWSARKTWGVKVSPSSKPTFPPCPAKFFSSLSNDVEMFARDMVVFLNYSRNEIFFRTGHNVPKVAPLYPFAESCIPHV